MDLNNVTIGRNIARYRKMKEMKASDLAERIGMKEATYTKYERGESNITIDFVKKVAQVLEVDPIALMTISPSHLLKNISNSSIAIQENSTFQTVNQQQTETMLQLMQQLSLLNERLLNLLENVKEV